MISDAKYEFDYVDIFAWTLAVIILSVLIEQLLSFLLTRILGESGRIEMKGGSIL